MSIALDVVTILGKESGEKLARETASKLIIEGASGASREGLEKILRESSERSLKNFSQIGLLEGAQGGLKELLQKFVVEGSQMSAKEAAQKILAEGAQGNLKVACERVIIGTSTSSQIAELLIKEAGGNTVASKLVKSPVQAVWDVVSSNPKLTLLGFTTAGSLLYVGIKYAQGQDPTESINDIADVSGAGLGVLVSASNKAGLAALNSSGILDFLKDLWEKNKIYAIGLIVVLILCSLSAAGATLLK